MPRERSSKRSVAASSGSTRKVAKKVVRKTAAKKPAARKRVSKRATTARKAPTQAMPIRSSSGVSKLAIIAGVACLMVIGGSVVLGFSDDGEINVAAVVEERKEEAVASGETAIENVPAPNNVVARVPNGGLRGKGKSNKPATNSGLSATATTTVDVASSTEPVTASSTATTTDSATSTPETTVTSSSEVSN